jgi:hypothetical protein
LVEEAGKPVTGIYKLTQAHHNHPKGGLNPFDIEQAVRDCATFGIEAETFGACESEFVEQVFLRRTLAPDSERELKGGISAEVRVIA